jgi:hypothetical protein
MACDVCNSCATTLESSECTVPGSGQWYYVAQGAGTLMIALEALHTKVTNSRRYEPC